MNGDRFFLDTNIFVYALSPVDGERSARAIALTRLAGTSRRGVVSYQVVQEFFSVALRKFRQAVSPPDAEHYLEHVFRPLMAVEASMELFHAALALERRHRLAWYDALIVAAAQAADCRILYSEDFQHGQEFGRLRVVNPFA